MDERRKTARQRSYLGASAQYSRGTLSLSCLVRDVSQNGARLRFGDRPTVGTLFDLVIANAPARRNVSVVWQRGLDIGVAFTG